MEISVFTSDATDSSRMADDLVARLEDLKSSPDFVALHLGTASDPETVRRRLADRVTGALHGATSCRGVMSDKGMCSLDGAGAGLFCLHDPAGSFGTALRAIGEDPREAARQATEAAIRNSGRAGEAPDIIWLSASPGAEEMVLNGIQDVVGKNTPILGGSAADNDNSGDWKVFDRDRSEQNGVVVSALFPSGEVSHAYQSGYVPTAHTGTITRCDGRRLIEIDNRPAADVYDEWTGGAVLPKDRSKDAQILSASTFYPLGRYLDSVGVVPFFLLAHPVTAHPDGSIDLFTNVEEGEEITAMEGSVASLAQRAGKVANLATQVGPATPGEIKGALVVYCGSLMLAAEDQMPAVVSGVRSALPNRPFLGIFAFGEQGPALNGENRHGNLMISCITFSHYRST